MYFYNILPTKNIGNSLSVLSYSSQYPLQVGDIVEINIRSSNDFGLVINENNEIQAEYTKWLKIDSKTDESIFGKIKPIVKKLPLKVSQQQMQFIKLFSDNTFNSVNDVWDSCWKPLEILTQKQISEFAEINSQKQQIGGNIVSQAKIEFELISSNTDYAIRIIYIIRNIISNLGKNQENNQILVVFPEQRFMNKIYKQVEQLLKEHKNILDTIELCSYTGSINKNSKHCVLSMIKESHKTQVIFTTRSGIFLPFYNLKQIILIDEANSMYIQDQNSIYYDTREAVVFLSTIFKSNLNFISRLPSIRLYNSYSNDFLIQNLSNTTVNQKQQLKLKIARFDKKSAQFNLFGWEIEQLLKKDEDL